jgi:hypothetical protein
MKEATSARNATTLREFMIDEFAMQEMQNGGKYYMPSSLAEGDELCSDSICP